MTKKANIFPIDTNIYSATGLDLSLKNSLEMAVRSTIFSPRPHSFINIYLGHYLIGDADKPALYGINPHKK